MVSKVYAVICGLFALTAAVLFVTGNFSAMTAIVFGFAAFGLIFMGMMFVLPYTISHPAPIPVKQAGTKIVTNQNRSAKPITRAHAPNTLAEPLAR